MLEVVHDRVLGKADKFQNPNDKKSRFAVEGKPPVENLTQNVSRETFVLVS